MDLKPEHWVRHPEQANIELKNQDDLEDDEGQEEEDASSAQVFFDEVDTPPDAPFVQGSVRMNGPSAAAFLMADDMLTAHGLSAPGFALKNAVLGKKYAPVWIGDRVCGRIDRVRYDRSRHALVAYFTPLNPKEKLPLHRLVALPLLDDQGFSCGTCGRNFQMGHHPCPCVMGTSALILQKISVIGVKLWDQRKDSELGIRLREELKSRYFGGSIFSVQFSEPL